MNLTEDIYKKFSDIVYRIDKKHNKYEPTISKGEKIKVEDEKFVVIKTEDNTTNGMQAMAVAPMKQNEVDTSDIIIAYAGTSSDEIIDIQTDIQSIVLGNKDYLIKSSPQDILYDTILSHLEKTPHSMRLYN